MQLWNEGARLLLDGDRPGHGTVHLQGESLHLGDWVTELLGEQDRLAGAEVMVADLSDLRLAKARACGLERTVNPQRADLEEAVMDWTSGQGVHVAVEAIGISEVIAQAAMLTRRYGELILLGSPRARAVFDVTPMLLRVHLEAIRVIGAL